MIWIRFEEKQGQTRSIYCNKQPCILFLLNTILQLDFGPGYLRPVNVRIEAKSYRSINILTREWSVW